MSSGMDPVAREGTRRLWIRFVRLPGRSLGVFAIPGSSAHIPETVRTVVRAVYKPRQSPRLSRAAK